MNIVCQSRFLDEGLRELGHTVHELPPGGDDLCLEHYLHNLEEKFDVVLLQLWGYTKLPTDLATCTTPLAAYAVDSSLNEFWLASIGRLFTVLFVDQLVSVQPLRAAGINAHWLPLCAQQHYFRQETSKKYGISFVGTRSAARQKRHNLLQHIKQHCDIALFDHVSLREMQDICAASHIVLNENLFSGVTLRVFQALASGSLLFTEADGHGMERLFHDGQHLVAFRPDDIGPLLGKYLENASAAAQIARAGQACCAQAHTSQARAREMLAVLQKTPSAPVISADERRFFDAKARLYLARRYGGSIQHCLHTFNELANLSGPLAGEACLLLGDIALRRGRREDALECYAVASRMPQNHVGPAPPASIEAWLRLAFAHASAGNVEPARTALANALTGLPKLLPAGEATAPRHMAGLTRGLGSLHSPADIVLALGKVAQTRGQICHLGFARQENEKVPETALDLALFAHNLTPSREALALALACAESVGMAGELLPTLLDAMQQNLLDDIMIAKTAEAAKSYYDFDLARELTRALGKRLR